MHFKSPFPDVEIPNVDVLTWLFGSPYVPLSRDPIYFDSDNPDQKNLSLHEYRSLVKRLSKGIKTKLKLESQDKLLVFSGNNIYFPVLFMGAVGAECVF